MELNKQIRKFDRYKNKHYNSLSLFCTYRLLELREIGLYIAVLTEATFLLLWSITKVIIGYRWELLLLAGLAVLFLL